MKHMTDTPTLEDAIILAAMAHCGQVYPSPNGEPYILHLLRVMLQLDSSREQIVAMLHDLVEDTSYGLNDLRDRGYDEEIITSLDCLMHCPGEPYDDYIRRVAVDPVARRVKLADLGDNLANNRRLQPSDEVRERIARYERALARLSGASAG